MTEERWDELMEPDSETQLTRQEAARGWHFCWEWDGLLVGPGMGEIAFCGCLPEPLLSKLKKAVKDYEEKVLTEPPF